MISFLRFQACFSVVLRFPNGIERLTNRGIRNPSADDKRIPDAGHVVNLDQPERFNAVLRDFLDRR